eukprot:TRINITY_DN83554_c0_g1_i1.p1 TRINITY_DN83554_c0_g1~~TRINITY_DN83554_c0_g1_i1.p1  ORF type:complete len:225 (+),score=36.29 TRINITY_DN83554_c0_g1_i1:143-817(+)
MPDRLELASKTYKPQSGAWKCSSFPELNPRLYGHRLGESSCVGTAKWQQPHPVVYTNDWFAASKGSIRLHARDPGRADWVWHSDMGTVHGSPSQLDPPVFGWQPKVPKYLQGVDLNDPAASMRGTRSRLNSTATSLASSRTTNSKKSKSPSRRSANLKRAASTGTLAQSASQTLKFGVTMPDLLNGELRYPPSPAFVRNFLRTCDFKAKLAPLPGSEENSPTNA